jgi:hypothetical protein
VHEPITRLDNPFKGKPGFWNRVNRIVYTFTGPAQVGIGRPESAYVPPSNPTCPVCKHPMSEHDVRRGDANTRTQLNCPR